MGLKITVLKTRVLLTVFLNDSYTYDALTYPLIRFRYRSNVNTYIATYRRIEKLTLFLQFLSLIFVHYLRPIKLTSFQDCLQYSCVRGTFTPTHTHTHERSIVQIFNTLFALHSLIRTPKPGFG